MPCIGSTTTPSTRRSCPHTVSTRAASWMPSTQIRLARAVRAVRFATFTDPDADTTGPLRDRRGDDQRGGPALDQERGRAQREDPVAAVPVFQGHLADVHAHHRAAEPAGRVLDDDPALGGDLGDLPLADDPPAVGAETCRGSRASWPTRKQRRRDRGQAGASRGSTATNRPRRRATRRPPRPRRPVSPVTSGDGAWSGSPAR